MNGQSRCALLAAFALVFGVVVTPVRGQVCCYWSDRQGGHCEYVPTAAACSSRHSGAPPTHPVGTSMCFDGISAESEHGKICMPGRPRLGRVPGCEITPAENSRAAALFERMVPVLQHPRCANCHGKLDVFAPSAATLHGRAGDGGVQDRNEEKQNFKGCQVCHTRAEELVRKQLAPGASAQDRETAFNRGRWRPATRSVWGPLAPDAMCRLFKDPHRAGQIMEDHLRDDVLVILGFEGKRGQDDLAPEPPPMSHAEFQALAKEWMLTMKVEEQWPESPDCGCP